MSFEEEASFWELDQGLQLLDKVIAETSGKEVNGAKAFELYDTFGFLDLTALILRERGFSLDEAGLIKQCNKKHVLVQLRGFYWWKFSWRKYRNIR
jgi:alanyl-tRNA synthetase